MRDCRRVGGWDELDAVMQKKLELEPEPECVCGLGDFLRLQKLGWKWKCNLDSTTYTSVG